MIGPAMLRSACVVTAFSLLLVGPCQAFADEVSPLFETDIQPLLTAKCGKCHDAKSRKGGLDLSSMATLKRGGESGEPAIAESIDDSPLWVLIDAGEMPPDGEPQLSDAEKRLVHQWLKSGAKSKSPDEIVVTQHDVLPFLFTRCIVCHGRRNQDAGLDLRSVESILKGGKSGPAVVPGKPAESLLIKRVHAKEMPPPKQLIRAGVRPLE